MSSVRYRQRSGPLPMPVLERLTRDEIEEVERKLSASVLSSQRGGVLREARLKALARAVPECWDAGSEPWIIEVHGYYGELAQIGIVEGEVRIRGRVPSEATAHALERLVRLWDRDCRPSICPLGGL